MKFDFDDLLITPSIVSSIDSRKDVNPFDEKGMLPIMTAPMDTVVDENNYEDFIKNKINIVHSRHKDITFHSCNKYVFFSYGLNEFKEAFLSKQISSNNNEPFYALIDIANGNMNKLFDYANQAKEKYEDDLILMVGNIANPKTFEEWCKIGVDYVRVGIGNGNGCLTSQQTGIGYPMGSLIKECYEIKKKNGYKTKIVADGGFKKFSDIIKAICLGADYVMLGSMLNKCYESSGGLYTQGMRDYEEWTKEWYEKYLKTYQIKIKSHFKTSYKNPEWIDYYLSLSLEQQKRYIIKHESSLYKKFNGMSTKEVQKKWGRVELKTSEGISTYNKVEYTLKGFTENLEDYLRSAMSYTNSKTLEEFKGSQFELITENTFKRFNK